MCSTVLAHSYACMGNDKIDIQIISAIEEAKESLEKPTFIVANTVKGKGVSYMENNPKYHGSPPASEEEYRLAISELSSYK